MLSSCRMPALCTRHCHMLYALGVLDINSLNKLALIAVAVLCVHDSRKGVKGRNW